MLRHHYEEAIRLNSFVLPQKKTSKPLSYFHNNKCALPIIAPISHHILPTEGKLFVMYSIRI